MSGPFTKVKVDGSNEMSAEVGHGTQASLSSERGAHALLYTLLVMRYVPVPWVERCFRVNGDGANLVRFGSQYFV